METCSAMYPILYKKNVEETKGQARTLQTTAAKSAKSGRCNRIFRKGN
jgi:hypothetical protein